MRLTQKGESKREEKWKTQEQKPGPCSNVYINAKLSHSFLLYCSGRTYILSECDIASLHHCPVLGLGCLPLLRIEMLIFRRLGYYTIRHDRMAVSTAENGNSGKSDGGAGLCVSFKGSTLSGVSSSDSALGKGNSTPTE